MIRVLRDSRLPREIVGRAQRHHAERDVVAAIEPVHDLVERPIAAARDHDVGALVGGLGGEMDAIAGLPSHANVHRMATLAHPRHDVPELGAVGAPAMDDEGEVLASRHREGGVSGARAAKSHAVAL